MIEIDNIRVNKKIINMIKKEIKVKNKDLYDQIDELNKLNKQNILNIDKYIANKNNHIVKRYIYWCDHAEKENDGWNIDSELILENIYTNNDYELICVMDNINDDLFIYFLNYKTSSGVNCYEEPDYIDKCIKLFDNLTVDEDDYDKRFDKEYLAKVMEEMIKVNVESFINN